MIQKRAIGIVTRLDYYEPTNALFTNLHAFKFCDLVDLKTAQIVYKIQNNLLPNCMLVV